MKGDLLVRNDKISVLIVDDDKTLCKMLEDMLSREEHLNVTSTHDGHEATQKIKTGQKVKIDGNLGVVYFLDK